MVRIGIFRTPQIKPRPAATQRRFIQEKHLNLDKKSEFWSMLTCTTFHSLSQVWWHPYKLTATYHSVNQQPGSHHKGNTRLKVLHNFILTSLLSIHITCSSPEHLNFRLSSTDPTQKSPKKKIKDLIKLFRGSCLNLCLSEKVGKN